MGGGGCGRGLSPFLQNAIRNNHFKGHFIAMFYIFETFSRLGMKFLHLIEAKSTKSGAGVQNPIADPHSV